MRKILLLASVVTMALGGTFASSNDAEARRAVCKERAEIIQILGLQNDRRVLELYASPNGSWTAILTLPSGKSCVVASGEAWTTLPPMPIGEPA